MTFEKITREKAGSVGAMIPQIVSRTISAPPEADFYMAVEEKLFSAYYIILIALGSEIIWLSDEDYRGKAEAFLAQI